MIRIIVENHAHRLMKNGTVESAKGFDEFKVVDPVVDLDMDPADFNYIRQQLEILHSMFPEGRTGVPKSEKIESVPQIMNTEK